MAFLNKGLEITLTDERTADPKTGEARRTEFRYAGGISEFVKHLNRGKSVLHDKPIVMEALRDAVDIDIALQYNDATPKPSSASPTTSTPSTAARISPVFARPSRAPSTTSASRWACSKI